MLAISSGDLTAAEEKSGQPSVTLTAEVQGKSLDGRNCDSKREFSGTLEKLDLATLTPWLGGPTGILFKDLQP